MESLPAELREALRAEIDPGETLRWCAQPHPGRMALRAIPLAILVLAGLGVLGGMTLGAAIETWRELGDPAVARHRASGPGRVGAGALIAAGAVLCAGALMGAAAVPLYARARARRTVYALTDMRVFILIRSRARSHTAAVEPGHPLSTSRREHADGTGDVALYPGPQGRSAQLLLAATPEPRQVERLIRQTFDPPGAA